MIVARIVILTSAIIVAGCTAVQKPPPTTIRTTNDAQDARLYDETAYYNAVRNLWFGLDDPAVDRDKPAP